MTLARALALLLLASCATAPNPPAAQTTAQPTQAPGDTAQQPKIVQAQALLMGRPMALPPEVVAPRAGALAPRTGALAPRTGVMAPETVGPAPMGEIPPLIIVRPPKAPETPERAPPETTKPPPPVIVNPPEGAERETEEAGRQGRPPKPNRVTIADPNWVPAKPNAPRHKPCLYHGEGGPGSFRPEKAPSDWVRCAYRCGRYQVILNDMRLPKPDPGRKLTDDEWLKAFCTKWIRRAEDYARNFDDALKAQGQ